MSAYRSPAIAMACFGVAAVSLPLFTGCIEDKLGTAKGAVDTSAPPDDPGRPAAVAKADAGGHVADIDVHSPHPYPNNHDVATDIDLDSVLPWCASRAQLHFSTLRTEADYDRVTITASASENIQQLDGNHDDTWSEWFFLDQADKSMTVRLESDDSVTDFGFVIDQVRWQGSPICPAVVWPPCPAGSVDVNPPPGVCDCPQQPACVATADIEIQRQVFRGFDNKGKLIRGHDAFTLGLGPADGIVETNIGTVDEDGLLAFVRDFALAGMFESSGYDVPGEWNEYFRIRAGGQEVVFRTELGQHESAVQTAMDRFLKLFRCDDGDEPLTCGDDYACTDGACVESCICTEEYDPVCGTDRRTYGNDCMARCAGVSIVHPGECGIDGDMCGGFAGWPCADGFKCFGAYQIPDGAGVCRPVDYCEAPADCADLVHPATPGEWGCDANQCVWRDEVTWQRLPGGEVSTAHPYPNHANVWTRLYLPDGATTMRLSTTSFDLEDGYDFLEVWSYDDGWRRVARYTGTAGPREVEFAGRYHYLHFVSDPAVTGYGFDLFAEYR